MKRERTKKHLVRNYQFEFVTLEGSKVLPSTGLEVIPTHINVSMTYKNINCYSSSVFALNNRILGLITFTQLKSGYWNLLEISRSYLISSYLLQFTSKNGT